MLIAARVIIRYRRDSDVSRRIELLPEPEAETLINTLIEWFGKGFMSFIEGELKRCTFLSAK